MILYTADTCPMCNIAKTRLEAAGIKYTVCQDEERMNELNIDILPVAEIDGKLYNFKEICDLCKEDTKE